MRQIRTTDIPEVRAKLLNKQKQICPICRRPVKDPVLDHDHKTDAVRDTLCRNCNRVEGKILHWIRTVPGDNIELLRNIAKYWVRHSVNRHNLLHPGRPKRKRKRRKKNATA